MSFRIFSCGTQAPEHMGSVIVVWGLGCSCSREDLINSFPTKDGTCVSCIAKRIHNDWTTRKVSFGCVLITERNTCVISTLKNRALGIYSKSIFFVCFKYIQWSKCFPALVYFWPSFSLSWNHLPDDSLLASFLHMHSGPLSSSNTSLPYCIKASPSSDSCHFPASLPATLL